jgi:hypothetical protein
MRDRMQMGSAMHMGDAMQMGQTQRFLAERVGAQIRAERVDHTPIATAPEAVVEVILEAVASMPQSAIR